MPCDTKRINAEVKAASIAKVEALGRQLSAGTAKIVRNGNTIKIEGWVDRGVWCDICSINKLRIIGDFKVKQMLASIPANVQQVGHGH